MDADYGCNLDRHGARSTNVPSGDRRSDNKVMLARDLLARYRIDCSTVTPVGVLIFAAASGIYAELRCGSYGRGW
jgi:hypothetical protein